MHRAIGERGLGRGAGLDWGLRESWARLGPEGWARLGPEGRLG